MSSLSISVQQCDLESSFFCSQVPNYPLAQIDSLLDRYMNNGAYFVGSDAMIHWTRQRSTMQAGDEQMCETDRTAIYPKMMKNQRNVPTLIVQSSKLKQMILVERCL